MPKHYLIELNDSDSKIIITADGTFRRGKFIELKKIVDEAVPSIPSIEHVIVVKRTSNDIHMNDKRRMVARSH